MYACLLFFFVSAVVIMIFIFLQSFIHQCVTSGRASWSGIFFLALKFLLVVGCLCLLFFLLGNMRNGTLSAGAPGVSPNGAPGVSPGGPSLNPGGPGGGPGGAGPGGIPGGDGGENGSGEGGGDGGGGGP